MRGYLFVVVVVLTINHLSKRKSNPTNWFRVAESLSSKMSERRRKKRKEGWEARKEERQEEEAEAPEEEEEEEEEKRKKDASKGIPQQD